jgi:hypothetical protein
MRKARRWMILVHRYLGVGLGALFLMWFVSGVGMIYTGGMPQLSATDRRERMPPLDRTRIRLTPLEAAKGAGLDSAPQQAVLLTIMGRPAYRFTQGRPITVFADTGEVLAEIAADQTLAIAAQFMGLPIEGLRHIGVLTAADQWTIGLRRQLPLHKIAVNDERYTELYVSSDSGEVVMHTTRPSRMAAWVAAIPHWIYVTPLRINDGVWRQVVLWTSSVGTVLVLLGLALAVVQLKPLPPYIPYAGWLRWHYISGTLFGVFALTWVFSGMLSMQPFNWAESDAPAGAIHDALSGGPLDLSQFDARGAIGLPVSSGGGAREIELRRIQGEPYYLVWGADAAATLFEASAVRQRSAPFSAVSLLERVQRAYPDAPILSSAMLQQYDAYYYARAQRLPLPVMRITLGDRQENWLYIDPALGELRLAISRKGRWERWLYHGLHSFDFSFWYDKRPLWDIVMIVLSLGGGVLSAIGVVIGVRRVARSVR